MSLLFDLNGLRWVFVNETEAKRGERSKRRGRERGEKGDPHLPYYTDQPQASPQC